MDTSTNSFVAAVLATAGRLDKDDLNAKLDQLSQKIEAVKVEVYDALVKKYEEFFPLFDATRDLREHVSHLQSEIEGALAIVEKQVKAEKLISSSDCDYLQLQCCELCSTLKLLDSVMTISGGIHLIRRQLTSNCRLEATQTYRNMQNVLTELQSTHGGDLKILPCLAREMERLMTNIESSVVQRWSELVSWKYGPPAVLVLATGPDVLTELTILAQCMSNVNILRKVIDKLSDDIMYNIIDKCGRGNEVQMKSSLSSVLLSVGETARTESGKMHLAVQTLVSLETLFSVLHGSVFCIVVDTENEGGKCRNLMSLFSQCCATRVIESMRQHCLLPAIPANRSELTEFAKVASAVDAIHKRLVELEFLEVGSTVMTECVTNVNVLFANKRSVEILTTARSLMLSDIQNCAQVSNEMSRQLMCLSVPAVNCCSSKTCDNNVANDTGDVCLERAFCFPSCYVSVSAQQLVQLALDVLNEIRSCDDGGSEEAGDESSLVQLFCTVRHMFDMFASIVDTYHYERIISLPQAAALYHNDCMYVAHYMMLIGRQFSLLLPPPLNSGVATFLDMTPELRRAGTSCLLTSMTTQKSQLLQILSTAHGLVGISDDGNADVAERALSQILNQLRHLVSVWINILPAHIYVQCLGTLLNAVAKEVVSEIIALDDISENDAHTLNALLAVFVDGAYSHILMPISTAVSDTPLYKLVPVWQRLAETRFLLVSRLQEIVDRWTNGPLSNEMTAAEVKSMMRALFQNTAKRAMALASIK